MFQWLNRMFRRGPAPLTGVPRIRREKTYSADSGYVYRYHFEGYRVAGKGGVTGTEYVFTVRAGPKTAFPVPIFLDDAAVSRWEKAHGRDLASNELYAIVKMALFDLFDRREHPSMAREGVHLEPGAMERFTEQLGLE